MAGGTPSHGITLSAGDGGGPEVFTAIAGVLDITGPTQTRAAHDVSAHDCAAMAFVPGLLDNGEVTFSLSWQYGDAQQDQVRTDMQDGSVRNYELQFPTYATVAGPLFSFAAFVTGFSPQGPVDGALTADVTFKITGTVTET